MCMQCLGHFPPLPAPSTFSLPHPLATRQKLFCPYLKFCWIESIRNKKEHGTDRVLYSKEEVSLGTHSFLLPLFPEWTISYGPWILFLMMDLLTVDDVLMAFSRSWMSSAHLCPFLFYWYKRVGWSVTSSVHTFCEYYFL
jgi:hypothetical protein